MALTVAVIKLGLSVSNDPCNDGISKCDASSVFQCELLGAEKISSYAGQKFHLMPESSA